MKKKLTIFLLVFVMLISICNITNAKETRVKYLKKEDTYGQVDLAHNDFELVERYKARFELDEKCYNTGGYSYGDDTNLKLEKITDEIHDGMGPNTTDVVFVLDNSTYDFTEDFRRFLFSSNKLSLSYSSLFFGSCCAFIIIFSIRIF